MTQRLEWSLHSKHNTDAAYESNFFVSSCVVRHDLCSWSSGSSSTTFCFNFSPSCSIDSWQNIMISDGVWRRVHVKMWCALSNGSHVSLWWSNAHINHSMNRLFWHMRIKPGGQAKCNTTVIWFIPHTEYAGLFAGEAYQFCTTSGTNLKYQVVPWKLLISPIGQKKQNLSKLTQTD